MRDKLLPCPFCGKAPEYVCEEDHHGEFFRLGCPDEDCTAHWAYYTEPKENAEECIRRWNTRTTGPRSSERIAQAVANERERCAKIADDQYDEQPRRAMRVDDDGSFDIGWHGACNQIAKVIRAEQEQK